MRKVHYNKKISALCVQINLTKFRIDDFLPIAAAKGFVPYWPLSNTWFLGPPQSAPQTASRSVQPFFPAQRCMWPTHRERQTHRPRYVREL